MSVREYVYIVAAMVVMVMMVGGGVGGASQRGTSVSYIFSLP